MDVRYFFRMTDNGIDIFRNNDNINLETRIIDLNNYYLVFDEGLEKYILFEKKSETDKDKYFEGQILKDESNVLIYRNGDDFLIVENGEIINEYVKVINFGNTSLLFHNGLIYVSDLLKDIKDNTINFINILDKDNLPVFIKLEDNKYMIFHNGENITEKVKILINNNSLIAYYDDLKRQYLYKDVLNLKENSYLLPDIDCDEKFIIVEKINDTDFKIFYKCNLLKGNTIITLYKNSVIFYFEELNSYYKIDNWRDIPVNTYFEVEYLVWNNDTIWMREDNYFYLLHYGRNISEDLIIERDGFSAKFIKKDTSEVFYIDNLFKINDGLWRAL